MPITDGTDVAETYNGHHFPILSINDYLDWAKEIGEEKKAIQAGIIPADLSAIDRWKILRSISMPASVTELEERVQTIEGVYKVLTISLTKSGKAPEQITEIIEQIPPNIAFDLVMTICGLFRFAPPSQPNVAATNAPQTLESSEDSSPLAETPQTLSSV
jgi:hypothetical protein